MFNMAKFTGRLVLVAVFLCSESEAQQSGSGTSARIWGTQRNTWVAVIVAVSSSAESVVIPACGSGESDVEPLCDLAIHMEVKREGKWRPVELRYKDVILGGLPVDKWRPIAVARGTQHMFTFKYLVGEFAIRPGDKLRLVVDTWQSADAMRNQLHPGVLITDSFSAP